MNYFLISVANKENLEACLRYCMAGFTNSINGFWTFCEIDKGDYISFLYGARVYNLYKVVKKEAWENAEKLPPWQPITFRASGRSYYFPFRLILSQERNLNESMVRMEFSYVAENLLLRGGYRKTHFQADTITFYNVSTMGEKVSQKKEPNIERETFIPKIVFNRKLVKIPYRFYFHELILQSLIRKKIYKDPIFKTILENFGLSNYSPNEFEILGEKALPEGHIDIFIKNKHPNSESNKIIAEVKVGKASTKDVNQLVRYMAELGKECKGGILFSKDFSKILMNKFPNILFIKYAFKDLNTEKEYTYENLLKKLVLYKID